MKIGIMGSIPQEIELIKNGMEIEQEVKLGDHFFYVGKLHGCDVVLVFSRIGKVAAASVATTLINLFEIDFLLFTGVAGAVHSELNVGDIVIGKKLYQHDMDASPLFPKFEIPLTGRNHFFSEEKYVRCAEACLADFITELAEHAGKETLKSFSITAPKVVCGTIATGDQFITNPADHADLMLGEEVVYAVEMEGAAVAQVCYEYEKPFLVIRMISDKANQTAFIDFKKFIDFIANSFSKVIVQKLLPELVKLETTKPL